LVCLMVRPDNSDCETNKKNLSEKNNAKSRFIRSS
jgi:hypothetical protein